MNPDDDGTTLTPLEIADEEYVGAMQEVCDAVAEQFRAQSEEIELAAADAAEQVVADRFFAYEQRRDALRTLSEEAARMKGEGR